MLRRFKKWIHNRRYSKAKLNSLGYYDSKDLAQQGWIPRPKLIPILKQLDIREMSLRELEVIKENLDSVSKAYEGKLKEFKAYIAFVNVSSLMDPDDFIRFENAKKNVDRLEEEYQIMMVGLNKITEIINLHKN